MKHLIFIALVSTLILLAGIAIAADQYQITSAVTPDNWRGGYGSVLEDVDGNLHIVWTGAESYTDPAVAGWGLEPQIIYAMVEPDGTVLIDETYLTVGGSGSTDKNRAHLEFVGFGNEGHILIVYHQEQDDVHMMVIDPSAHPQDGTSANATATTPAPLGTNVGTGVMSEVWTAAGATTSEDWTVTYDGTEWTLVGSVTGAIPESLIGNQGFYPSHSVMTEAARASYNIFDNGIVPFGSGDGFTFTTTASPILVTADTLPISEVDSTRSVGPRAHLMGNGDMFIGWREGGGSDDNNSIGFLTRASDGTMSSIQYFYDAGVGNYLGNTGSGHIRFHYSDYGIGSIFVRDVMNYTKDKPPVIPLIQEFVYMAIDPTDAMAVVEPTYIRLHGNVRMHDMETLPDGNVIVAFHSGIGDGPPGELFYGIFDPRTKGLSGDPLVDNATATASKNTGDGTITDIMVSLSAPSASWTVTCTDNSTPGSEVWEVANDATNPYVHADAITGAWYGYENDNGDVAFLIEAGTTPFAVGDSFTFETVNNAMIYPITNASPGNNYGHPDLYVNPDGAGVLLTFTEKVEIIGNKLVFYEKNVYYYILGYDGEKLAGPTKISDIQSPGDINWAGIVRGSMLNDKVLVVWSEMLDDGMKTELGDALMLGVDDYPVTKPEISAITPNQGYEGQTTDVTITGTGFDTAADVTVGEEAMTNVTVASATTITATVPDTLAVGTYDVMVINPDTLYDTVDDGFEVMADDDDDDDDDTADDDDDDDDDDDTGGGGDDDDDDDDGCCGC